MQHLLQVGSNSRLLVLAALTAALYTACLVPFKVFAILPGITEIRPGAVIPLVCALLFGPAACWGAALGNVMGDLLGGQFGPASVFGFAANFMGAYVPYRIADALGFDRLRGRAQSWLVFCLACVAGASATALVCGWGVDWFGLVPFAFLGPSILLNNTLVSLVLGPPLLAVLQPRVQRWNLHYRDILDLTEQQRTHRGTALLLGIASVGGMLALLAISFSLHVPFLTPQGLSGSAAIRLGGVPFVLCLALAVVLL